MPKPDDLPLEIPASPLTRPTAEVVPSATAAPTGAGIPSATAAPTGAGIPSATAAPTGAGILSSLVVAPAPAELPAYDRKDWRHWVDADGDCQDARQEALIAESVQAVTFASPDRCRVATGQWRAPYTGVTVDSPRKLDVDHMVPLANAHRSGGHAWTRERKREYANYLDESAHLIAVTASANRSKGSRGPEAWKPPDAGYWCQYAKDWANIKGEWQLTVTPDELAALREMMATCGAPVR